MNRKGPARATWHRSHNFRRLIDRIKKMEEQKSASELAVMSLRLDPDLHKALSVYAVENRVSRNAVIREALVQYLAKKLAQAAPQHTTQEIEKHGKSKKVRKG